MSEALYPGEHRCNGCGIVHNDNCGLKSQLAELKADRDALKRERDAENRVGRNCTRLLKAVGAERDALRAIGREMNAHCDDVESGPREVNDIVCLVNVREWARKLVGEDQP